MLMTEPELKASRRKLMLRDGLAFLVLTTTTGALFAVTLFLFRSFAAHRAGVARQAAEEGRLALHQNRPKDAIADLRTALSYAPGDRAYELMLAQALGEDGRLEEATNYFLNLWDSQPGDGFINLQLARLARRRSKQQEAINYYRASIFGNWNGDGTVRRREVRLELAAYLSELRQYLAAQAELLIAASNAPADPGLDIIFGDALLVAQDPQAALKQYRKSIADGGHTSVAYIKAGRLAFELGDYPAARDLLRIGLHEPLEGPSAQSEVTAHTTAQLDALADTDASTLLRTIDRLLALSPDHAPTRRARITALLGDRTIAKARFDGCYQQAGSSGLRPQQMQALAPRWADQSRNIGRAVLIASPDQDNALRLLVDDTERITATICGPPQGDDALLLRLAQQEPKP